VSELFKMTLVLGMVVFHVSLCFTPELWAQSIEEASQQQVAIVKAALGDKYPVGRTACVRTWAEQERLHSGTMGTFFASLVGRILKSAHNF